MNCPDRSCLCLMIRDDKFLEGISYFKCPKCPVEAFVFWGKDFKAYQILKKNLKKDHEILKALSKTKREDEITKELVEQLKLKPKEGWGFAINWRKAHYIVDGRSLCGKWLYFGTLEQGKDKSPDNCLACVRRLAKRRGD